jgi:hypothetical protein
MRGIENKMPPNNAVGGHFNSITNVEQGVQYDYSPTTSKLNVATTSLWMRTLA